jgi:O-antigen/teichoic acid export membrane protein
MSQDSNSRLAKNTIVLYFRMAFQMAVFLYTSRVVLRMLGIQDYGIYDVVAGIVVMLSFLNNSLTTCTQRFITFALGKGDHTYLNKVYSISIGIHVLMALLVLILGETVGLWYVLTQLVFPPEMLWSVIACYQCSLGMGMLLIVSIPYNATIIAYERMTAYAAITIMDAVLKLGAASALCMFAEGERLVPYALLMLGVALITRVSYSIYCKWAFPRLRFRFYREGTIVREMLSFAGWSTFGNASIACNTQGLNLVLNSVGGPAVNAARGVAFQVQMAVTQFVASFQTAINPQITKTYAQGDVDQTRQLVLRSSRLSYMLILLITVPLLLAAPFVLKLWLGLVPDHSVAFMRLMLLVSMVDAIANPMMVAAAATGNIRKYHICIGTILLLTLPIALICVKYFHMPVETVFVILLAMTILAQCARMVLCRELFGLSVTDFCRQVLVRVLLVSVFAVGPLLLLFQYVDDIWTAVGACVLSELWLVAIIGAMGLQQDERMFVLKKLKIRR